MRGKAWDAVVVGAGFGGLGAALRLAEGGARVLLLEALAYPGGCASTFERDGYRFESGATLFSGFDDGQLFRTWIDRHQLDVTVDALDPVVAFRAPGFALDVPRTRAEFRRRVHALDGAPHEALDRFFDVQERVADVVWTLLDDPDLLPPFGPRALWAHLRRLPRYLPLLRLAGRPVRRVLERCGVADFRPLVTFLDALCQITVQCGVDEAEAPFALATMDYYFRGAAHVRGGIGSLAWELLSAIRRAGGEIRMTTAARALRREDGVWRVETRDGTFEAPVLVANLLPQVVAKLADDGGGRLAGIARDVADGWGACMLYLVARAPAGAPPEARHVQIVADDAAPFTEGNHLFCSISSAAETDRAPAGTRTLTVSTHVPMRTLLALDEAGQAAYVAEVQQRMRDGLAVHVPDWWSGVERELTASPRTFERFTRRYMGYVGGVPRRAGLAHYASLKPRPVLDGLYLVGDSVFPGQSTLATALGGVKVAERVLSR